MRPRVNYACRVSGGHNVQPSFAADGHVLRRRAKGCWANGERDGPGSSGPGNVRPVQRGKPSSPLSAKIMSVAADIPHAVANGTFHPDPQRKLGAK